MECSVLPWTTLVPSSGNVLAQVDHQNILLYKQYFEISFGGALLRLFKIKIFGKINSQSDVKHTELVDKESKYRRTV